MADNIKTLNTRIGLKIDTLENWNSSTLGLLKGEIAIATTAATAGTGLTEPVCMIKIGEDGIKTFSELSWNFYAKAADVLSACKTEAGLKSFINNVIAEAGIATDEALTTLAGRVTTAEGEIDGLQAAIEILNGSDDGSVAKAIADAIADLKLSETYEVKGEAAKVQGELNSYKESNDVALANVKATAEAAYVKPTTGIAKTDLAADVQLSLGKADSALQEHQDISHLAVKSEVETELGKKVDQTAYNTKVGELEEAINGKQAAGDYATKTEAQGYADAKDEAIAAAKKAGDDAAAALATHESQANAKFETKTDASAKLTEAKGYTDTEVKKVQDEVDALETYVGTIPSDEKYSDIDNVVAYVNKKAEETLAAAQGDSTETATSVKNALDAYIEENDEKVQANTDAIDAIEADYLKAADKTELSNAINAEKERAEGIEGGLRTDVDAIKADYLKAADKNELQGAISAAEESAVDRVLGYLAEEVVNEKYDTLKEVAAWIESDTTASAQLVTRVSDIEKDYLKGADKTELQGAIDALEGFVGELPEGAVSETVVGYIQEVVDGLKIGDYAKAADLTALAGRVTTAEGKITTLEGKAHEHANKELLDTYTQTEVDLADAVSKKHEHANKTVLDGITSGKVTAWDAAVQTVTAGTGLTATKTGTDVAIGIDESVTFIFNCGGAGDYL